MNKKPIYAVSGLILAMLIAAWLLGWFGGGNYSADPKVAELEKARDKSLAKQPDMGRDQRRSQRAWFEEQMKGLTEEQRWAFIESSAAIFIPLGAARFESEYDNFMKLSPAEQQKELDKRIDEMEARGGPGGGPGGGGGRPPIDPKRADEFRKKMNAWTTPDQRAKFENGIRMFNDRRKERGLDPVRPPGGGGGFF